MVMKKKFNIKFMILTLSLLLIISAMQFGVKYSSAVPEDSFEDNDNIGDAKPIDFGDHTNLALWDEDWYSFNIGSGEFLNLSIWFNHIECDMELELYDEWDNLIESSYSLSNMETIVKLFTYNQNLKLRIFSADYSNQASYTFDLGKFYDPNFSDIYEENDIRVNATDIGTLGHFDTLMLNDDDWYCYGPVSNQETIQILLKYDRMASLNIELIDESGNPHGYMTTNVPEGILLEWTANTGYSLINIYIHGDYGIAYELDISNQSLYVLDDPFEPNDSWGESQFIADFQMYYQLYQNDDDWYEFWLMPNDVLEIHLYYSVYSTNMNLSFYDDSNILQITEDSTIYDNDHKRIVYSNFNTYGIYVHLRVSGPNMGDWYDMELFLNGGNLNGPTLDDVAYKTDDNYVWDVEISFDDDGGPRGTENYQGTLEVQLNEVYIAGEAINARARVDWINLPDEFIDYPQSEDYIFWIDVDGYPNPGYFGYGSLFTSKYFTYSTTQPLFNLLSGLNYEIIDNGRGLKVINDAGNTPANPWFLMEFYYTDDGILKDFVYQYEYYDESENFIGKVDMKIRLAKTPDDVPSDGGDGVDPFGFDIPGFKIEYLGLVSFSIIGIIIKKRKN